LKAAKGPLEVMQFQGQPLTYATVTKSLGAKAYLHPNYPAQCGKSVDRQCAAKACLVPGDTVAVAKSCRPWSYVQYIGEKRVGYGWVRSDDSIEAAASSAEPARRSTSSIEFSETSEVPTP
jgi:hypothetical protein